MSGPVSVVASPLNQGVKLIITNPAIPPGFSINYYSLYEPTIFPSGTPCGATTTIYFTDPSISNGTTYVFSVAINWFNGTFSFDSAVTPTTPASITPAAGTPPTQIPISILPRANPSNIEIWWDPPASSGSTPLLSNYIEMCGDSAYTNIIQNLYRPASSVYFNINEQSIFFPVPSNLNYIRIQAINENFDKGPFANYLFTQIGFFPSEPQTPTATRTSATSAQVSWTAPASDGGAAIQYYVVNSLPVTAGVSTVKSLYSAETTVDMTGLSSGVDYTFSIEAVNPPGYSPAAITPAIGP